MTLGRRSAWELESIGIGLGVAVMSRVSRYSLGTGVLTRDPVTRATSYGLLRAMSAPKTPVRVEIPSFVMIKRRCVLTV